MGGGGEGGGGRGLGCGGKGGGGEELRGGGASVRHVFSRLGEVRCSRVCHKANHAKQHSKAAHTWVAVGWEVGLGVVEQMVVAGWPAVVEWRAAAGWLGGAE